MAEKEEILLSLYLDDIAYARHHESLRSAITNLILAAGAAMAALITFDSKVSTIDRYPAGFLILLGILGALFSYKHYERFHFHYARARNLRAKVEEVSGLDLSKMREKADKSTAAKFPTLHKLSVGILWTVFPLFVSFAGVAILCLSF